MDCKLATDFPVASKVTLHHACMQRLSLSASEASEAPDPTPQRCLATDCRSGVPATRRVAPGAAQGQSHAAAARQCPGPDP